VEGGSGIGDILDGGQLMSAGSGDDQTLLGGASTTEMASGLVAATAHQTLIGTNAATTFNVNPFGTVTVDAAAPSESLFFTTEKSTDVVSEHTNAKTGVVSITFDTGQVVKVAGLAQATFADEVTKALPVTTGELAAGEATAQHEAPHRSPRISPPSSPRTTSKRFARRGAMVRGGPRSPPRWPVGGKPRRAFRFAYVPLTNALGDLLPFR
jgi:hypothetical protein